MRRRPLPLAILAVTATATATATTGASATTPATEERAADSPRWGACPQQAAQRDPQQESSPRLECSTLQVPLDYGEPDGRRIEIAISRLASDKPAKRRGVLFVNPGGPGGQGLDHPALLAPTLPQNVQNVQNERDPGTPLAGARKLRQAFGKRATMVTVDQGGHGVYPFGRNTCANDTVTAFLTTGQRPPQDLACAAEPGK